MVVIYFATLMQSKILIQCKRMDTSLSYLYTLIITHGIGNSKVSITLQLELPCQTFCEKKIALCLQNV